MVKTLGLGIITENIVCNDFFKVLIFISFHFAYLVVASFLGSIFFKIPCYVNNYYLSGRTDFM